MKVSLYRKGQVEVCRNNTCVKATGHFAEIITAAIVFTIIAIGVSALLKSAN